MSDPLTTDSVLGKLRALQAKVDSGKHYGFEQSIWRNAADEIERLRAALAPLTNIGHELSLQEIYNARKALGLDAYGETP